MNEGRWRFAADQGGTFTDVIGVDPDNRYHVCKLLSVSPQYDNASIEGVRRILGLLPESALPNEVIAGIRLGTTVGTNALLERQGGRVLLLVSDGFADLLEIGYQARPDIFSLAIEKPPPLYTQVVPVPERLDAQGESIQPLNAEALRQALEGIAPDSVDAVAVVLLHSWVNPVHELGCAAILEAMGFPHIILSHQCSRRIRVVSRGQSTVMDAYLSPVLARYREQLQRLTGRIDLAMMQSSGGLCELAAFTGKNALLSGPAGGVIAVAALAETHHLPSVIGFDMGGTSTDVCRYDGRMKRFQEKQIAGMLLQTEMLAIETVAAGGGSKLWFDGQRLRVGPQSAGAMPGPACYGFGGPLTVTDANLITGRIAVDSFPKTFGPERNQPLDVDAARRQFEQLCNEVNQATGARMTIESLALGCIRIANETMAQAIKHVSVAEGFDVREDTLVCFGGAAGQHACAIARLLGMKRLMLHPLAGILSAYGIGIAKPIRILEQTLMRLYDKPLHIELETLFYEQLTRLSPTEQVELSRYASRTELDLRPLGAENSIAVPFLDYQSNCRQFETIFEQKFGYCPEEDQLEVAAIRVILEDLTPFFPLFAKPNQATGQPVSIGQQPVFFEAGQLPCPIYARDDLSPGSRLESPAIIVDALSTLIIEPGFSAAILADGVIVLEAQSLPEQETVSVATGPDPVLLEVFHHAFMGIATEMGHTLQKTAHSVNIRERLDFSCAVFDCTGNLIANAPHQPVHLGSMSDTVRAILRAFEGDMNPGDVFLMNDPYQGGSHLPDMTVVAPVFSREGELRFFTASRGHHADVGGTIPGSMPPTANHIEEEGILFEPFRLVSAGCLEEAALRERMLGHRYPVRNYPENRSNFEAQMAACHKGAAELVQLVDRSNWTTVSAYMGFIQDNADFSVRQALNGFVTGRQPVVRSFADGMDDGTPIAVCLTIDPGNNPPETLRLRIDFAGTGSQHLTDNLNAPLSVTRSAVLYVLRVLMGTDIPLNEGCIRSVDLVVPEGSLLAPIYPAPVASGNVETSQRIVDVLLGAFGVAAASQGTMNNLLFEVTGETPYYETIAGGSGATEGHPGASGVQVHMTNTRMTDPEVLELRHPGVRLEQFTLRRGSGGRGRWIGGDGVVRRLRFLKPATVTLLTERRKMAPFGMAGGQAGDSGENLLISPSGEGRALPHRAVISLQAGEAIEIKTPGGGGFGE